MWTPRWPQSHEETRNKQVFHQKNWARLSSLINPRAKLDHLKLSASPCSTQATSIIPGVPRRNLPWDDSDCPRPYRKSTAELRAEPGLGQPQSMPPRCRADMLSRSHPRARSRAQHAAAPSGRQGSAAIKNYSLPRDVGESLPLEVFKMRLGRVLDNLI